MASSSNVRAQLALPREARAAVEAVFDALSEWREEVSASNERHSETVVEKMSAAARALGWPKELVEASQKHSCKHPRCSCRSWMSYLTLGKSK